MNSKIALKGLFFLSCFMVTQQMLGKTPLKVGAVHYPPYYDFSRGNHNPTGLLVDHLEELLDEHYMISWDRIPLIRGEYALKKGMIDMYGSYASPALAKRDIKWAKTPLLKMQPIICGLGGPDSLTLDKSLAGKTVLYPHGGFTHPNVKKYKLVLKKLDYSGNYIERSLKLITKGRAHFMVIPENLSILSFKSAYPKLDCENFAEPIFIHTSFPKNSPHAKKVEALLKTYPSPTSS